MASPGAISFRSCHGDEDYQSLDGGDYANEARDAGAGAGAVDVRDLYNPASQETLAESTAATTRAYDTAPLFHDSSEPPPSTICPNPCARIPRNVQILLATLFTALSAAGLRIAAGRYYSAVVVVTDWYCSLWFCFFWTPLLFAVLLAIWKSLIDGSVEILPKSKCVYCGAFLYGVFFVLHSLSVSTARTPQYLQYICIVAFLPLLIIARRWRFKQGLHERELAYSAVSLAALFITCLPYIVGMVTFWVQAEDEERSLAYQILWPLCYLCSMGVLAWYLVTMEIELKRDGAPHSLSAHFHAMLSCHLNLSPVRCPDVYWLAWVFVACYCCLVLSYGLLLHVTGSALYTAMAGGIAVPLLQLLYWSLVTNQPELYQVTWQPAFTAVQGFAMPGLLLSVLATVLYYRLLTTGRVYRGIETEDVMAEPNNPDRHSETFPSRF